MQRTKKQEFYSPFAGFYGDAETERHQKHGIN